MSDSEYHSPDEIVEEDALNSVPFLSAATVKGLNRLSERTTVKTYQPGEIIFSEGEPATTLFVIKRGQVEVFTKLLDGTEEVARALGRKQMLGELGVLGGHPRSAGARAVEETEVWAIEREAFLELYESEPAVTIEVASGLAKYLLDADMVAEDLLFLDLEGRVAKRLLAYAGQAESHIHHVTASGDMTEEQVEAALSELARTRQSWDASYVGLSRLAELSGGSRIAVGRIIEDFERDGLIITAEGELILLKPEELAALAKLG
ncbi:MAG: family transcriptional regulator, cyclic receptor protein [Actinomycetota bacterium]|nr:family transcriptional regulator, cyclic receptor protein [Actinomycetota bacterium]